MKFSTKDMALMALFAALTAVGAFIKIPLPTVPLTLQLFFVIVAADVLGSSRAAISTVLYVLMGLLGLPVFASGGGFWYVTKPSFGFFLGFIAAALIIGKLAKNKMNLILANFIGLAVVYFFGTVYCWAILTFYTKEIESFGHLLFLCIVMPLPGDIAKCLLAAFVSKRLRKLDL